MRVDTNYRFVGPAGEVSLLDLFEGRRQLIVYRFFYAPDVEGWPEGAARSGCSMFADSVTHPAHLNARDTTLVFVSAAPQERIESYRRPDGMERALVHAGRGDHFSRDFDVEEYFGINVFIRDDDEVFPHLLRQRAWCRDDRIPLHRRSSTSRRSVAKRPGRTPRRIALKATRMSGGDGTRRVRPGVTAASVGGGDRRHHLRRAEPHEAKELEELQDRSASHWDYPDGYFDWAGDALEDHGVLRPRQRGPRPGRQRRPQAGLLRLHQGGRRRPAAGQDVPRRRPDRPRPRPAALAARCRPARDLGPEFVIGADRNAAPFYEATGAKWHASKPTEEPTWTVQMYRFALPPAPQRTAGWLRHLDPDALEPGTGGHRRFRRTR